MRDFGMPGAGPGPVGRPGAEITESGGRLRPLIVVTVILAIFAMPQVLGRAAAQTNDARLRTGNVGLLTSVTLVQHKSRNLRFETPFAVVEVADPDIADARAISDRQLFILGKKIGATNVLLYDPSRKLIGVVDVEVKMDTRSLGSKIREGSGGKGIRVNDVYGKLVLSGNGGDSQTVERAMNVAKDLAPAGVVNALKVTTPQQVMLKVRFVEANREAARNLGIRWEFFKHSGNLAGVVGTQTGTNKFNVGPGQFAFGPVPPATSLPLVDVVGGAGGVGSPFATIITQILNNSSAKLDVVLSALEEQNVIRKLAEPNLIAMSGETADFLAGGEYPVPVVSAASAGTLPTVTIIYKEFGVKLSFTPTVLARGVISLKLVPEVSALDFANAVSISGTIVPALTTRRARTTVELRDGQSFAIAGLLQDDSTRLQDQLPWLGSVPVLGALFRSSSYQAKETELVVLVTPYLIKPVPPGKKLKTPLDSSLAANDIDYFLNGQPEVPKTPPFAFNPFGGLQSLFGGIEPGPPAPAPAPVPVAAPVAPPAPVPVPVPAPVPQVDGALRYDPATGYFIDPPTHGGGK